MIDKRKIKLLQMGPYRSSIRVLNLLHASLYILGPRDVFSAYRERASSRSKPLSWTCCSQELTRLTIPMSKWLIAASSYPEEGDIGLHISLVSRPC